MNAVVYQSTKTYTHAHGLSCCFRQWRADSHCNKLHGYSLQVKVVFEGPLDERNWVQDFGGLKYLKSFLEETFDHKTLVAMDDPQMGEFEKLAELGIIDLVKVHAVGCEKFAEMIYRHIDYTLPGNLGGVIVRSVEVAEHPGNSAIVMNTQAMRGTSVPNPT